MPEMAPQNGGFYCHIFPKNRIRLSNFAKWSKKCLARPGAVVLAVGNCMSRPLWKDAQNCNLQLRWLEREMVTEPPPAKTFGIERRARVLCSAHFGSNALQVRAKRTKLGHVAGREV